MLTPQETLAYAKMVGYPRDGWTVYEANGKVWHAKRTEKPYEVCVQEVEFKAPGWIPQHVVDEYIKGKLK